MNLKRWRRTLLMRSWMHRRFLVMAAVALAAVFVVTAMMVWGLLPWLGSAPYSDMLWLGVAMGMIVTLSIIAITD